MCIYIYIYAYTWLYIYIYIYTHTHKVRELEESLRRAMMDVQAANIL